MIASSSQAGYLMRRPPHPPSSFFELSMMTRWACPVMRERVAGRLQGATSAPSRVASRLSGDATSRAFWALHLLAADAALLRGQPLARVKTKFGISRHKQEPPTGCPLLIPRP
jgi:hypothetical protein